MVLILSYKPLMVKLVVIPNKPYDLFIKIRP